MDDDQILNRGGDDRDIAEYAKQNGADLTPTTDEALVEEFNEKFPGHAFQECLLKVSVLRFLRSALSRARADEREKIDAMLRYNNIITDKAAYKKYRALMSNPHHQ